MYPISETTLLSTMHRPDDHSKTIATFHTFTHTETGTLILCYLHSHEHTILSVPTSIIIFMNKYLIIFI